MRYAQIRTMDLSNGPGIRITLFVQGCAFHCKNCFNSETWDFNGGKEWTDAEFNKILELGNNEHVAGLSILGGEPLHEDNVKEVGRLITAFKSLYPNKTVWVWSGFTYENLNQEQKDAISNADVLVDGRFVDELKDFKLKYRGSSNQRVIDLKTGVAKEY